jgi:DNA polymerase
VGRPFIGPSGILLDKIFTACGFNRKEHLFISNIVRCRPPGNRPPPPHRRVPLAFRGCTSSWS